MKENFAAAMKVELTFEGGKVDHPSDPGGRTNQGIIQRVYNSYRVSKGLPVRDVFLMDTAERDEIYRKQYFDKVQFDNLPPGVDLVVVDGAINSGVSQSIKWVQRALGLTADGVLGTVTMQRIQDHPDHDRLIADILARRMAFLRTLKTFSVFGRGWTARVNTLKLKGQSWAMGSVGPEIVYIPNANRKAELKDAKAAPVRAIADATAAGGTVSTALTTAQGTLEPLQGNPFIDKVLLAILVAGALLTVGGLVWGWYARKKAAEREDVLDLVARQPAEADNDNMPVEVEEQYSQLDAAGKGTKAA